jgi:outer membrane protein TolC
VKTTRVAYDASLEQFRSDVMDVVSQIQDGYWNLIATEDQVGVEAKSLETAEALLDQTRTQFQVGVISKVEVVESEAGVADRQFNLIVAQNRYENSQDLLIDLILGPHLTADSNLEIDPRDRPQDFIQYVIDPALAVQRAFAQRPELVVASKDIERREIRLKFETNQRLPQLDLVASYGYTGISGNLLPVTAANPGGNAALSGNYGHSYNDFFSSNGPNSYSIGGAFSIPIPNTAARHRVSRSKLELRRSRTLKRRLEQDIILEVRRAVRGLRSAQEGIQAAQRGSTAAGEQLRAERIRLEYGESTPFDVLLRESDFVEAESQLITAFQAYRTSVTALDRAQGTILQNSNIAVEGIRPLR